MSQFLNEYEGVGNALMNIGSMYYADSERKKEEARKRKELEDERKYQEAQADKAYARQAPLELLKQKLAEARIASAEADKVRTETQTYMPKTQMLGNIARTTMPVRDANGNLSYESTDETMQPLNPTQAREPKSPYVEVGNEIVDTRTMTPAYTGKASARTAKDPNVLGVAERARIEMQVLSEQAALDAMSDSDLQFSKKTTRAAEQAKINAKKSVLDKYSQKAAPDSGGSVASGLFKALMGGVAAAPLGRTEESAAAAGITGKVPLGVAAQSIAASTGEPVNLMGAEGTPPSPKAQENKQPAPGSTKETAILVTSAEQMAAIPDGTWVKTPKGTTRRK